MIYLKRIFFIISCIVFSFLVWNFWNTHASINQNNIKINSFVHKIYDIKNNSNIQLNNILNDLIFLNINLLRNLSGSLNTLKNSDFLNKKYLVIDFTIIKNFFYEITSKT
ncbi:hypothetical protein [Buchnera aphidicola]|uniref:hypothetical protein n=1 Tax=Buchnera aphidicola TaxID=9 RepID=UPI0012AB7C59|nr:hypothetical protein [Buchnera aphidicola]